MVSRSTLTASEPLAVQPAGRRRYACPTYTHLMRLSHITKRFGANIAVDDVSLDFAPGEIIGLVGENGAGKTTLMSIAAGELAADEGTIEDRVAVGVVHQHFLLVSEFTIAENLALAMWGRDAEDIIRDSGI